jgi:hypothetical protein
MQIYLLLCTVCEQWLTHDVNMSYNRVCSADRTDLHFYKESKASQRKFKADSWNM